MTGNRKKGTKKQRKNQMKGVIWVGTPTQTSKGLEDRERGGEERARKQDREGEKSKKGEPAGQGGTLRNNQTGSRIERQKNWNRKQDRGTARGNKGQGAEQQWRKRHWGSRIEKEGRKERPEEGQGIIAKGEEDKEQDRLSEKDRERDKAILREKKGTGRQDKVKDRQN